jgi:alkyl hydroperoxide reductase subunit AhpC
MELQAERLHVGDEAPDFRVMAAHHGEIVEVELASLLEGKRGLVLTSYVLDFTGG